MIRKPKQLSSNAKQAAAIWGPLSKPARLCLKELVAKYRLSVIRGDLQFLDDRWYVTHSGLIGLAERKRCAGISVRQVRDYCDPASRRWVFRAMVYKRPGSRGFVGYGDADPSNVSPLVHGAEMRVAETRAVNRALRKAYGIGLCSVEELKWLSGNGVAADSKKAVPPSQNGSSNGQPRLRDQLCSLIRQYSLDPTLVKAHAADFCGTQTLSSASRELVESFITHLAAAAKENRDALVCKLNSYAQPVETQS